MRISNERLTSIAWWRISLASLCLAGTMLGQNFDWSTPLNLGETINTPTSEQ